jgi:hypothetical protein
METQKLHKNTSLNLHKTAYGHFAQKIVPQHDNVYQMSLANDEKPFPLI